MEGGQIGLLVTRIWLLLCACVVLGLSADLANFFGGAEFQSLCKISEQSNHCNLAGLIPDLEYGAFTGAWGLIQVAVGLVALFVAIPWIAVLVVDGLAFVFYIAAGAVLSVWLSKHLDTSCHNSSACTKLKADAAFMWLGFLGTLATIVLVFVWQRKR